LVLVLVLVLDKQVLNPSLLVSHWNRPTVQPQLPEPVTSVKRTKTTKVANKTCADKPSYGTSQVPAPTPEANGDRIFLLWRACDEKLLLLLGL